MSLLDRLTRLQWYYGEKSGMNAWLYEKTETNAGVSAISKWKYSVKLLMQMLLLFKAKHVNKKCNKISDLCKISIFDYLRPSIVWFNYPDSCKWCWHSRFMVYKCWYFQSYSHMFNKISNHDKIHGGSRNFKALKCALKVYCLECELCSLQFGCFASLGLPVTTAQSVTFLAKFPVNSRLLLPQLFF